MLANGDPITVCYDSKKIHPCLKKIELSPDSIAFKIFFSERKILGHSWSSPQKTTTEKERKYGEGEKWKKVSLGYNDEYTSNEICLTLSNWTKKKEKHCLVNQQIAQLD